MTEKKIECKTYVTKYEAYDGNMFDSKSECEAYERTARAVIEKEYNTYVGYSATETEIFNTGCDECEYQFILLTSENKEIIMRILEFSKTLQDRELDILNNNIGKYIVIGHSTYDNYHYLIGNKEKLLNDIINKFNGLSNNLEEK